MKEIIALVVAVGIVGGLAWVGWKIERKVNYSWSYQEQVREEIRTMVKAEALK